MKKIRLLILLFGTLGLLLAFPGLTRADGIIIPEPPICDPGPCPPPPCPGPWICPPPSPMLQLVIRYHRVTVKIEDQVAVTRVDQVFYNPNDYPVEGDYVFPLPVDAAVSSFTLWVDGEPVKGKVLEADEARRTYEDIVRNLHDPALLEYAGRGAVQAHIFPIPARGERRVELEYTQALAADNGLVRYVYPLNTEKYSLWPLEQVSVSVELRSAAPLRAVYSPTHKVDIRRDSVRQVRVSYEAQEVRPDADFALYYSLGEEQAFHLLSFRDGSDPADPDGFFLLLLAPNPESDQPVAPKDVFLVLDRSGSMEGEKFQQAQEALRYVLKHLNPEDRFNIITFSTDIDAFDSRLQPASQAGEALSWVGRLSAAGSTDINRALLETCSYAEAERPTYVIFLTDGLPTEGVVESGAILENLESAAPQNLRLFAFGVGYDVDTYLLDSLASAHHGTSNYVLPGERLDESLSSFYERISTPVLTDLELDFGDMEVYDVYPQPLPDLFRGSQVLVVGRYRQGGVTTVTLSGALEANRQTFHFPEQDFARASEVANDDPLTALPRLWATRKIGNLLNQIRLKGADQETIDQIVRLSIRYGIITPYTSYLVTEPMPLGAAEQERIAGEQFNQIMEAPPEAVYGAGAVQKAADQGAMAGAEAPLPAAEGAAEVVRIVGARTFVLSEGVWVDTAYDPERMSAQQVPFLSKAYFELAEASPDLAKAFALGERVIAFYQGQAYEVVAQGAAVEPVELPPSATPDAELPPTGASLTPTLEALPTGAPASPVPANCLGGMALLAALPLALAQWFRGVW